MQQQVGWVESWKSSRRKWHLSLELQASEWLTRGHSKQRAHHLVHVPRPRERNKPLGCMNRKEAGGAAKE